MTKLRCKNTIIALRFDGCAAFRRIMNSKITLEKGLSAYFKQPSGPSRPGVQWFVQIYGQQESLVLVRTYYSSNSPQESEKQEMAEKAIRVVKQKLEQGWIPKQEEFLEADEADVMKQSTSKKPWWKIF
jgi:hypothetical protein